MMKRERLRLKKTLDLTGIDEAKSVEWMIFIVYLYADTGGGKGGLVVIWVPWTTTFRSRARSFSSDHETRSS
jgi:hypothetical protein